MMQIKSGVSLGVISYTLFQSNFQKKQIGKYSTLSFIRPGLIVEMPEYLYYNGYAVKEVAYLSDWY